MIVASVLLVALAIVDGACSGLRASLGRSGLVRHLDVDRRSALIGLVLVCALLVPAAAVAGLGLGTGSVPRNEAGAAAWRMLDVLLPYAAVVTTALAAYAVLGWRQKYVAMALVLGPFTLVRPLIVIGAALAGASGSTSWLLGSVILTGSAAVLAVEPLLNRRLERTR